MTIKFTETQSRPAGADSCAQAPPRLQPDAPRAARPFPHPRDHYAQAAYWADDMLAAIRAAIATPRYTTIEDLELNQAVRCARVAWAHALKAKRWRWDALKGDWA